MKRNYRAASHFFNLLEMQEGVLGRNNRNILVLIGPGSVIVASSLPIIGYEGIALTFGGPLTGAGFNPARNFFGPAFASGYIDNLYVYFIGPILGAILVGITFEETKRLGRKRGPVCMC